jgi:hypothetical protein
MGFSAQHCPCTGQPPPSLTSRQKAAKWLIVFAIRPQCCSAFEISFGIWHTAFVSAAMARRLLAASVTRSKTFSERHS